MPVALNQASASGSILFVVADKRNNSKWKTNRGDYLNAKTQGGKRNNESELKHSGSLSANLILIN